MRVRTQDYTVYGFVSLTFSFLIFFFWLARMYIFYIAIIEIPNSPQYLYKIIFRGGIGRVEEKGAVLLCKTHRKADILTDPLLTVV